MSEQEEIVLEHLAAAWNAYVKLPEQHPCDAQEFAAALHDAQRIVGIRVARRADPDFWTITDKSKVSE